MWGNWPPTQSQTLTAMMNGKPLATKGVVSLSACKYIRLRCIYFTRERTPNSEYSTSCYDHHNVCGGKGTLHTISWIEYNSTNYTHFLNRFWRYRIRSRARRNWSSYYTTQLFRPLFCFCTNLIYQKYESHVNHLGKCPVLFYESSWWKLTSIPKLRRWNIHILVEIFRC